MTQRPDTWRPAGAGTRELLRDSRRVVPFVGAGLNIPVGMPSGPGLAETLRTEHPLASGKQFDAPDNLIDVSSTLTTGGPQDRAAVADYIVELLDIDAHGYQVPATLRQLVRIPSRWYVTTTYDLLPERAADEQGIPYRSFTWRSLPDFDDIDRDVEHPLYIVHLHGSVEDRDSLVLDAQSYQDISREGKTQDFLHLLFHLFHACFLGTALDEQYLQAWILSWRRQRARHVLIGDQQSIDLATQGRGAVSPHLHGVMVEAFPTGRFELLDEFCEHLVTRPASTSAPLMTAEPPPRGGLAASETTTGLPAAPAVRYVRADWGPDWTRRALNDLAEHNPEELVRLQDTLGSSDEPAVVERLIRRPEAWMQGGSFRLWIAAARFAEQQGDWQLAREAWEKAGERDGADRVRCLVSAAISADLAGDPEVSETLLERARALDHEHPRVRLQEVSHGEDLDEQLEQLRQLWDEGGDVGALAHAHAAIAYLMRGDFEAAERHITAARRARPDLVQARIASANLVIHRNRLALIRGERVDARALAAAKEECLTVRDELIAMRRWVESTRLLMLAADATALRWELDAAGQLLLEAREEEKDSEDGRSILAAAALRAQQHAVTLELLDGVPDDDGVHVMRASARLMVGNEAEQERSLSQLDAAIHTGGDNALRAAMVRATRAYLFPDAGWPADAERILVERGEDEAVLVSKAMWLYRSGNLPEAQRLLEPETKNVRVAEVLLQLAIWEEDKEEAARIATALLALGPDNSTRVRCAKALYEVGDASRAQAEASVVAGDATANAEERGEAYNLLAGIAADHERNFSRALGLFEDWAEADPSNERHIWGRVLALTRLTRHADALRLLEETHAFPRTMMDARLAVSVYARMDDPVEALRRITEVMDRAPERDEKMESQLQLLALHRLGDSELPEDLADRIRLPDAEALRAHAVSLDTLREQAVAQRTTEQAALQGVMDGDTATMALAAAVGKDTGSLWMRLSLRPLGFGFSEHDAADRRDAATALDRGAVWDPTAFFTLGGLGSTYSGPALEVLRPRSRVAQATLDDLDEGRVALLHERPAMKRTELVFDATTGEAVPVEWLPELVERDHARAEGMLALAQQLDVEPDHDPQQPGPADTLVDEDAATPLRAMAATFSCAYRTGLPIFSDDRLIRLIARRAGGRAFGTAALLDALQARGHVSEGAVASAREVLRTSGCMGVTVRVSELVTLLEDADGEPSEALRLAFYDPAPWVAEYGAQVSRVVDFLRRVFEAYPDKLDAWTVRLLAAMEDRVVLSRLGGGAQPLRRDRLQWHAEWLLAAAWMVTSAMPNRTFLSALRKAIDAAAGELGARIDPLPGAATNLGHLAHRAGLTANPGIPVGVLAQMPVVDVMRLVGVDSMTRTKSTIPPSGRSPQLIEVIERVNRESESRHRGRRRSKR